MKRDNSYSAARGLGKALLATIVALCLMLLATVGVLADTVNISDQAGVLNASQVRSAGSSLGYPVDIYTTSNFAGTKQSFNQRTAGHIDNARKIVIALDTGNRYLAIAGGRSVPLTNSQYNDAVNAFSSTYSGSGYTGATVGGIRQEWRRRSNASALWWHLQRLCDEHIVLHRPDCAGLDRRIRLCSAPGRAWFIRRLRWTRQCV